MQLPVVNPLFASDSPLFMLLNCVFIEESFRIFNFFLFLDLLILCEFSLETLRDLMMV